MSHPELFQKFPKLGMQGALPPAGVLTILHIVRILSSAGL